MNPGQAMTASLPQPPVLRHPATLGEPLGALVQHLTTLHAALRQLAELAGEKLAALRGADAEALQLCAARELVLLKEVLGAQQERNALLARLAQSLRCPQPQATRLTEIADRLPEPLASSLRARSAALREVATELQRKNQLAATVARNLQAHIRGIFAEVAGAAQESLVYGCKGAHQTSSTRCWVDAVG